MLHPNEIDRVLAAARARARQTSTHRTDAFQQPPTPSVIVPGRVRGAAAASPGATRRTHTLQSSLGTGINPWWRYEEENVPGGGHVMVNVGTGNMLLQDDDMAVPHKGISLTLRRTYNSQSQHDTAGTDGAVPSMYGNGWTNTFDAHLSGSRTGTISVWDVDGARYDYTVAADGVTMVPPPGQHAALTTDGATGYLWTKKSGTTYYFWAPDGATAWPSSVYQQYGAYAGRLYQIIARNRYTYLTFLYSWDTNPTPGGKISAIAAQTESGLTATLAFGDVGGRRVLSSITFPDGSTTVSYGYDANGNLLNVSRPPNNAAGTRLSHSYGYQTLGTYTVMSWADSPRWESCASGCGSEGAWLQFGFTGTSASLALSTIGHGGVINPTIPDGSSSPALQSGYPTSAVWYSTEYFTSGTSTSTLRDSDGHATNWVVDSYGRPRQTQECTATTGGSCSGTWLVSNKTWDSDNNLATEIDPRNNETYYLYDPRGNTTVVAGPYTTTSQGSFLPTKIYDYDVNNNVVAYCDENEVHQAGVDYQPVSFSISSNDSLCSSQMGSMPYWHATYTYPSWEPAGELASMTTPMGYTRTFSYTPSQQTGYDYGLPTAITGSSITQFDGSLIAPTQTFWYDASGSLACYSRGAGTWVLTYDADNRLSTVADPEDNGTRTSVCGKSWGSTSLQATTTYYPSGDVQSRQSMAAKAIGVQTTVGYDADGNVTRETSHHGCSSAPCSGSVTTKYYDGAGRLVEVVLPSDPTDDYGPASAWITRYLYDITGGGNVSFYSIPFTAHGNLFETQEIFTGSHPSTLNVKGQAFDALDRLVTKYAADISPQPSIRATTNAYDASATTLGLLTSVTDPLGIVTHFDYDSAGRKASVTFTGDGGVTPDRRFTYDPSGRPAVIKSAMLGTQQTSYDLDGRVAEVDEFAGGTNALTSPARIKYAYYGDGSRKSLSVTSSALTADPLMSYAYRSDGARTKLQVTRNGMAAPFSWTYDSEGRVLTQSDPLTSTVIPSPATPVRPGTTYGSTRYAYDSGGSLASLILPVNANFNNIVHDAEGSPTHYVEAFPVVGGSWPLTADLNITTRGEAQSLHAAYAGGSQQGTSGFVWTKTMLLGSMTDGEPPLAVAFDEGTGAPLAPDVTQFPDNCPGNVHNSSYTYDVKSRRIASEHDVTYNPDSCTYYSTMTRSAYDAEDHVVFDATDVNLPGTTIRWNPLGHPISIGGSSPSNPPQTLHYDADKLLFASDANGALIVLNVEALGQVAPDNTVTVNDRDYSGMTVMQHSGRGYTAWDGTVSIVRYKFSPQVGAYIQGSPVGAGPVGSGAQANFNYIHPDGFETGFGTVQGTRVSHDDGWTTPDAYVGDVHDPMSQKPFMWNRNNPYTYSDPSGFLTFYQIWRAIFHGECPVPETSDQDLARMQWAAKYEPDAGGREMPFDRIRELPKQRGDPPKGDDGNSLELHHRDQNSQGPIDEMTRTEHRLGENYRANHTNSGGSRSQVDHGPAWRKHVREHWEAWWDRYMHSGGAQKL
jgi:YD repeat-containing protein